MPTQPKRATIYLDPELHQALKIKSAQSARTISELVNAAIKHNLAKNFQDLSAFEERTHEPDLDFEDVLKSLRSRGKI